MRCARDGDPGVTFKGLTLQPYNTQNAEPGQVEEHRREERCCCWWSWSWSCCSCCCSKDGGPISWRYRRVCQWPDRHHYQQRGDSVERRLARW